MGTFDQVKLLESKVVNAIDFVKLLTEENDQLKEQVDTYQKRIDELEALIQSFREEQSRIEDGILSALNRLNQFEDTIEKSLTPSSSDAESDSGEAEPVETPEISDFAGDEAQESQDNPESQPEADETQPQ